MAYGKKLTFGRDYIIATPFDPRLIYVIPPAVARAGMDTGVARRPIVDMDAYELGLKSRMDPTASILRGIHARAKANQNTIGSKLFCDDIVDKNLARAFYANSMAFIMRS